MGLGDVDTDPMGIESGNAILKQRCSCCMAMGENPTNGVPARVQR
jgi:hypothetical protein